MLPNQIFHHIDRMSRVIHEVSLLGRLLHRKEKGDPATVPALPEYLDNPNLAQFKKLFSEPGTDPEQK